MIINRLFLYLTAILLITAPISLRAQEETSGSDAAELAKKIIKLIFGGDE